MLRSKTLEVVNQGVDNKSAAVLEFGLHVPRAPEISAVCGGGIIVR